MEFAVHGNEIIGSPVPRVVIVLNNLKAKNLASPRNFCPVPDRKNEDFLILKWNLQWWGRSGFQDHICKTMVMVQERADNSPPIRRSDYLWRTNQSAVSAKRSHSTYVIQSEPVRPTKTPQFHIVFCSVITAVEITWPCCYSSNDHVTGVTTVAQLVNYGHHQSGPCMCSSKEVTEAKWGTQSF